MTVQIVQADALNLDAAFVSQFHLMYTDPPYSKHVHASATSQSASGGTRKRELGFASLSYKLRRKVAECAAHVQRWSIVYSDVESANTLAISAQAAGAEYVRTMPWVRWSMPQLSGDRPPQGFESLVCLHRAEPAKSGTKYWNRFKPVRKRWNGPGNLTHLDELALRGDGKHKCEKPLDQALRLVSYFSDPGENVLDLFSGSGVIALACHLLGRNCFAIELDPVWVTNGQERLARAAQRSGPAFEERDWERIRRFLAAKDEPTAQQTEGPSVARAAARARDKEYLARITGL